MCKRIDKESTFQASQIKDGDIICFQKLVQIGNVKYRYPDVPSFLEHVHNYQVTIKYDESLVGKKVKVWWPLDKMFYEGVVEEFYPANKKHKISYLDGEAETMNLKKERWEILPK